MPNSKIMALTAECPQCGGELAFDSTPRIKQKCSCSGCNAKLEVVYLYPIMLDWVGPMPTQE